MRALCVIHVPQNHFLFAFQAQLWCCVMREKPLVSRDRGVAQPGSASALGAEGRRFESSHPDQFYGIRPHSHKLDGKDNP